MIEVDAPTCTECGSIMVSAHQCSNCHHVTVVPYVPRPRHDQEFHRSFLNVYVRRSGPDGRIVFDRCPTDGAHLAAPANQDVKPEPRRNCRVFLDDLVPEQVIGKKGHWTVSLMFIEDP